MLQHNKVPSSFWCLLEIYVDQCRGRCDDMYVVVNIMPLVPLQRMLAECGEMQWLSSYLFSIYIGVDRIDVVAMVEMLSRPIHTGSQVLSLKSLEVNLCNLNY